MKKHQDSKPVQKLATDYLGNFRFRDCVNEDETTEAAAERIVKYAVREQVSIIGGVKAVTKELAWRERMGF